MARHRAVGQGGNWTDTVYRVDPRDGSDHHRGRLPGEAAGGDRRYINDGFPQIAVGAGGVWATGGGAVARIDPDTAGSSRRSRPTPTGSRPARGRLVPEPERERRRDADRPAHEPCAAADQRRRCQLVGHRRRRRVRVGHGGARGCCVADHARCEPGHDADRRRVRGQLHRLRRRRRLGGQLLDGTVARIDPATNAVAAETPIGAVQSLAAGAGSAWVSTAGATRAGTLPASACDVVPGGGLARRADRLRSPAPGRRRSGPAGDGRRDPRRAHRAWLPRREVHRRVSLVRRLVAAGRRRSSDGSVRPTRTPTRTSTASWR